MNIKIAKRGVILWGPRITANKNHFTFSTAFCKTYKVSKKEYNCVQLGLDEDSGRVAIGLMKTNMNNQALRITFVRGMKHGTCTINPLIASIGIKIEDIEGTYSSSESAIDGPINVPGFSKITFFLEPKNRIKKQRKMK